MNELLHAIPSRSSRAARFLALAPMATPELVEAARRGDPSDLVCAFPNSDRAAIVDWLLCEKLYAAARTALRVVWSHDYRCCLDHWGLRGTIRHLEWSLPYETAPLPDLAPVIDVWRGCLTTSAHPRGRLSWTLDRRVAAFFCTYHSRDRSHRPDGAIILHRRIRRNSMLMYIDDTQEAEVLVRPSNRFEAEPIDWAIANAMAEDWRASRPNEMDALVLETSKQCAPKGVTGSGW
jgi:hypothetical protein